MDLFSNKSLEGTKEVTNYEIKGKRNSKLLFDFKPYCTFKHGDTVTNLIQARMLECYEKGHSIAPDSAKYVCFEIPIDINLEELIDNKIFNVLEQIGKWGTLQKNIYNHIGIINKLEDGSYQLFEPTKEVLTYVQKQMDKDIEDNKQLFYKRMKQEEFKKRISEPAQEYIQENKQVRQERKEKPILEEQFRYKIGDKIYQDFKGTDLIDGKILKISRLEKIYTEEQIILYSAFIQKLEVEDENMIIALQNIPLGYPVLFTLNTEIEEMLENEENDSQQKVLQLLSNLSKKGLNVNEMQYIGGIDKQGNICSDIETCSGEIKQQILDKKQEFKIRKEELEII